MTAKTTTRRPSPAQRKARRARVASRVTFGLGLVASLAANVAASEHSLVGILTGVWAPVALLLGITLLELGAVKGRLYQYGVAALAAVAGWSSYWHLVEVMEMAGVHDPITKYGMPLTVDVLMALASPGMRAARAATTARKATTKKTTGRRLQAV